MNGRDYRALRRLSTREDQTLALVGETCERVPTESLPRLLASGKIEPIAAGEWQPETGAETSSGQAYSTQVGSYSTLGPLATAVAEEETDGRDGR